jgi:hypothetical protein
MKPLRAVDMRRVVGAASEALTAALETRSRRIDAEMLNSAGSVSAEWYVETLWHYLSKRELLQGVSSLDVVFKQPARLSDKLVHFALPRTEAGDIVMEFHVRRRTRSGGPLERVPVAQIAVHRARNRRRHGDSPEPPYHPYGIEVRRRHLNSAKRVSWHTMVSVIMDVARRGAQFLDPRVDRLDPTLLYVVPRFSFTPLGDAAAQENLFIYPQFALEKPWAPGKTSATARVTYWAVAHEAPWPLAEASVTVVRTSVVDGVRRPVNEEGQLVAQAVAS